MRNGTLADPRLPVGWHIYDSCVYRKEDSHSSPSSRSDHAFGHWFDERWYPIESRVDLIDLVLSQKYAGAAKAREELFGQWFSPSAPCDQSDKTKIDLVDKIALLAEVIWCVHPGKIHYSIYHCPGISYPIQWRATVHGADPREQHVQSDALPPCETPYAALASLHKILVVLAKEKVDQIRAAVEV